MKRLSAASLAVCMAAASLAASEGRDIMKRSQDAARLDGSESVAVLTITDKKGNQRVRKFSSASRRYGEDVKMVMKFLEPADVKGTGILSFDHENADDDMWVFLPALRKTRRIVTSEKSKGFMGSEFSNADMTAPSLDDFTYRVLGTETVAGKDCWKLEVLPASEDIADDNGYSKKIVWVEKADYVTRKTEFYDLDDELLKVLTVHEVKALDPEHGKHQATDIEIKNVQNGRASRFTIEKIVFNPNVKDEYFTTQFLEK